MRWELVGPHAGKSSATARTYPSATAPNAVAERSTPVRQGIGVPPLPCDNCKSSRLTGMTLIQTQSPNRMLTFS